MTSTFHPKPVRIEGYVNVYSDHQHGAVFGSAIYKTRKRADQGATRGDGSMDPKRIACIKINFDEGRLDD